MRYKLQNKGYVAESDIHGYGVYAKDDIAKDELIEECVCPLDVIEPKYTYIDDEAYIWNVDTLQNYRLSPSDSTPYWLMPMGSFGIYNHSTKPNASISVRPKSRIVQVTAIADIKKDEEIVWDYGPKYKLRKYKRNNESR